MNVVNKVFDIFQRKKEIKNITWNGTRIGCDVTNSVFIFQSSPILAAVVIACFHPNDFLCGMENSKRRQKVLRDNKSLFFFFFNN